MEQTPTENMHFDAKDVEENKVIAALSYLGVLVFVPLLTKKDSAFAQAHAKQGLVMLIAIVILGFVPVVGWALDVVLIVLELVALINTLQGKYWKIPLAHDMSKKMNI